MADLKLFKINGQKAKVITPSDFKYEKQIQKLCEDNLEEFFGIRFLATEYSTGNKHKGRIDSLGIDENNCPVIIEYKLDSKENVINQGLFYLDWLMDHKADFEMLCLEKFGKKTEVDWSNPRLLCIARDFTKYDDYAIDQINRNIELIRYCVFDSDYVIFELASSTVQKGNGAIESKGATAKYRTIQEAKESSSDELLNLFEEIETFIFALGDDVQKKELKYYYAYSRIKNFVCAEIRSSKNTIILYVKVPFSKVANPAKFMRDVSNIGHYGTGDTEITITSLEDFEIAKSLIEKSYNES